MSNSYKGKILISTPDASDDIFSRSVILIIDHSEEGSFGLILNKKIHHPNNLDHKISGIPIELYEGGPVETDKLFFIIKGAPVSNFVLPITDQFHFTEDIAAFITAVQKNELDPMNVKAFLGYSGWQTGQLEQEIAMNSWTVVDIYNLDYTQPNDESLWKKVMQNLGGKYLLWANAPEDISLN